MTTIKITREQCEAVDARIFVNLRNDEEMIAIVDAIVAIYGNKIENLHTYQSHTTSNTAIQGTNYFVVV